MTDEKKRPPSATPRPCLSLRPIEIDDPPMIVVVGDVHRRIEGPDGTRFVIGSGAAADLVLQGAGIAAQHAVVTRRNGAWLIEDLGGDAGLWWNGQRIAAKRVLSGEEYVIGQNVLRFRDA